MSDPYDRITTEHALAAAQRLKAKCDALDVDNERLLAVAKAAVRVRDARRVFLASLKTACPDRSPELEEAEAEMDAALEAWESK